MPRGREDVRTSGAHPTRPAVRIAVLGPVVVDARVDLTQLEAALVAVLALTPGRTLPGPVLGAALWPQHAPTTTAARLRTLVSRVRRLPPFTDGSIELANDGGYVLRADADLVDTSRFRAAVEDGLAGVDRSPRQAADLLTAALALWRDDPLAAVPDRSWFEAELAELDSLRRAAVVGRGRALTQHGHPDEALPALAWATETWPDHEPAWTGRATALAAATRPADAVEVLAAGRRRLRTTAGRLPGPAFEDLERQLVSGATAVRRPARPVHPRRLPATAIGRDAEWAAACDLLDRAAAGQRHLLVVDAPDGAGGRRFVEHLAARALGEDGRATPVHVVLGPADERAQDDRDGRPGLLTVVLRTCPIAPHDPAIGRIRRAGGARTTSTLTLGPLDDGAMAEVVRRSAPADRLRSHTEVAEILRLAGGIPGAAVAMLRSEGGSTREVAVATEVLAGRLDALPRPSIRTIGRVLVEHPVTVETLRAAAGQGERSVLDLLDAAILNGVLVAVGAGRFVPASPVIGLMLRRRASEPAVAGWST